VLNQTFSAFELIVIDDGSEDSGPAKVKRFTDKRIRLISQPNTGVSAARNKGIMEARNDYVALLDADDWWDKHFLEEMKNLIERYPDAGLYGCNYYTVKNRTNIPSVVGVNSEFREGYIDYCTVYANTFHVPFNCSFVILPKAIFLKEQGFKTQLRFGEDFDLWIRIALKNKVAYLNKRLAYSNQDVPVHNRALGGNKIYPKESHFVFNLSYLEPNEKQNEQLKKLIDGLRVRLLIRYYLNNKYKKEVKEMLSKVDFSNQPLNYRLIYSLPIPVVKSVFKLRQLGFYVKSRIRSQFTLFCL